MHKSTDHSFGVGRPALGTTAAAAILLAGSVAQAHIALVSPAPRTSSLKSGPCGAPGSTRSTDPALITTYAPGETITVEFDETIDHPGHYRIAFDDEGDDDFSDPTSFTDIATTPVLPILVDGIADRVGGGAYSVEVTLPDVECSSCTLQVIQVMTDKAPYGDGNDLYYQCADLVLVASAGTGGAGGTGGAATGGTPTGGTATGGAETNTGGAATGGAATGGTATATGGTFTGGASTGGAATGGISTGGTATGGVPLTSGGAETASGGNDTGVGGTGIESATGGEPGMGGGGNFGVATGGTETSGGSSNSNAGAAPEQPLAESMDDEGCSCRAPGSDQPSVPRSGWLGALLLGVIGGWRRWRARRQ